MKKRTWYFVMLLLIPLVAACASNTSLTHPVVVSSRDEAAAVLISVNTVAPWDQIADAVQPNFSLTGDEALKQIIPTTERIQEQVLRAFGLSLGIGLSPESATSSIPIPQAPTGVPAGGQLPTAPSVREDIGLDPILRYQAALSLYQAVQLMNREVQYAATRSDLVPYLVTMKFAVMPYQRNLPYDIHARISFFPGDGCGSAKLPQVVPILVTDDIERALKSRAVEAALQIGLTLSAASHGVGGSLATNYVNQALNAISGHDINSRLTVARLSDNTIYARIGASYEATAGVAMVGQTNYVSLLLLVPLDYFTANDYRPYVQIFMHNELRDARNGSILASRPTPTLVHEADQAMQATLAGQYGDLLVAWNALDEKNKETIVQWLAGPIQSSNFADFEFKLNLTLRVKNKKGKEISLGTLSPNSKKILWNRFSVILADSSFKTAYFELPLPPPVTFTTQIALLLDDMKEKALVQLQTILGAPTRMMTGTLRLKVKEQNKASKEYQLVAQAISMDTNTGVLTLTFPSPAKWGIEKFNVDDSELDIGLRCSSSDPRCPKLEGPHTFKLCYSAMKVADAEPNLTFKASVTKVVVTKGIGSATVTVDNLKDDYALITVQGADVDKATDGLGTPLPIKNGQVKVTRPTTITFQLKNLTAGMAFTIQAEGHKGSKTTGKQQIPFIALGR